MLGLGLTVFVLTRQSWVMSDGLVYREAAERLAQGEALYIDPAGERSYRYAPWFAALWMLPISDALWLAAMTVSAGLAVLPALRLGWLGLGLGALSFPYLLLAAMGGHIQPALIAMLVYGLRTRWAPAVIAV